MSSHRISKYSTMCVTEYVWQAVLNEKSTIVKVLLNTNRGYKDIQEIIAVFKELKT